MNHWFLCFRIYYEVVVISHIDNQFKSSRSDQLKDTPWLYSSCAIDKDEIIYKDEY